MYKRQAYYICITINDIDIVVDPIYKLTKIKIPFLSFLNKYRYEIQGYAGYYENPITKTEWENTKAKNAAAQELIMENAKLAKTKVQMQGETEIFNVRGKNINSVYRWLSSINDNGWNDNVLHIDVPGIQPDPNTNPPTPPPIVEMVVRVAVIITCPIVKPMVQTQKIMSISKHELD